ncbi:MAG: hypothetical protein V4506_19155 [Bacteroidota bacterium]
MTHLELACAHFRTDKLVRLHNTLTGRNLKIKDCYVNTDSFEKAQDIYNEYLQTGDQTNILFISELDSINVDPTM